MNTIPEFNACVASKIDKFQGLRNDTQMRKALVESIMECVTSPSFDISVEASPQRNKILITITPK